MVLFLHLCKSSFSPGSYHNQVRATRGYTHLTTRYLLPGLLIASDLYLPSRQPSTSSHNTPHLKAPLTAFHSLARAQQSWILRPTEPFFLWSYFLPASIFQISLLLTNSALYLLTLGILYFPLHFGKLFKNYTQPNLPQWQKNNQARIIILLCRGESYFPLSLKEIITELLKYGHIFLTIQ